MAEMLICFIAWNFLNEAKSLKDVQFESGIIEEADPEVGLKNILMLF